MRYLIIAIWRMPLFLLLKYKQHILHNKESLKWNDDIHYFGLSFSRLLTERPQYKELLYRRLELKIGGGILKKIYGGYPLYMRGRVMELGGGLYMDHPHGTHLNAERIGKNLKIKHNVTIGNNRGGIPIIGDNVFIGCGGCVLGKITIGNNVKIGAGCVVTTDVPSNSVVIGNPAKIVKLNGMKVDIPL